jgi:NAD(P)-dependent dehydrogenase (short-subunit alcohol dehydrogenase family)
MTQSFAGKTIAITGAAGGVGQWLCRFFGEAGATIAALDLSQKVKDLPASLGKDGIKVKAEVADISNADAVAAAFKAFGDVHILINNAGVSHYPTLAKTSPVAWDEDMAANLSGA